MIKSNYDKILFLLEPRLTADLLILKLKIGCYYSNTRRIPPIRLSGPNFPSIEVHHKNAQKENTKYFSPSPADLIGPILSVHPQICWTQNQWRTETEFSGSRESAAVGRRPRRSGWCSSSWEWSLFRRNWVARHLWRILAAANWKKSIAPLVKLAPLPVKLVLLWLPWAVNALLLNVPYFI